MGDPLFAEEDRISDIVELEPGAPPFELRAGPYPRRALSVLSFHGREAISRLFSFDITLAASTEVDDHNIEADLIGKPACLTLQADDSGPRFVRGVLASLEAQGVAQRGRHTYRARLVPQLWLLKKRKTSRIFQEQTVPEIVGAVLEEAGVPQAWSLLGKYRPRTYCVQYQETDFAFVSRLLAEEGIFYFFDHGDEEATSETVTFGDSAHLYPSIQGDAELCYRGSEGSEGLLPAENHVQRFTRRRTLVPSSVLRRGYDFRRPVLDWTATAGLFETAEEPAAELSSAEIYEHHNEDEQPNIDGATVAAELEQHRSRASVAEGTSASRRLLPGFRFTLADHPMGRLDQEYVITQVEHQGVMPSVAKSGVPVYANTFVCVPAEVTIRPSRPERGVQQAAETATVVGPEGQEIHTDEYGRVKVQFPWDRAGQRNEHSSCWMRVAQAWAGTGWGAQFIPRIGMEVIVTFLGGDVDRPLITGCVPNAINVPPFALPGNKTKSGIRTQSTPGGGGFNELSFEDAKGEEVIHLRAERDLNEKILWNQTTAIGHNRHLSVGASLDEQIALDHASTVSGDRRETVRGTAQFSTGGERVASVGTNDLRHVIGNECVLIAGNAIRNVSGMLADQVQQGYSLGVRGSYDVHIGEHDAPKHGTVFASGNYRIIAGEDAVVHAERSLTLACGTSTITLSPEGITIKAASVTLEGDKVLVRGNGPEIRVGEVTEIISDKIHFQAKDASIDLERDARIDGKMVKLNCGPDRIKAKKEGEEDPTHAVIRVLQHLADTPCERMKVTVANAKGETREYLSGPDGTIRVEFNPAEKSSALRVVSMQHADDEDRVIHLSNLGRS